jgi:hypothetical protein
MRHINLKKFLDDAGGNHAKSDTLGFCQDSADISPHNFLSGGESDACSGIDVVFPQAV